MEEENNLPYYFFDVPSSSFPLSDSLNESTYSNSHVLDHHQSMQNPPQFISSDQQIDLASLLSATACPMEENPTANLSGPSNINTKFGRKKKYNIPPRVAFHTRSAQDILDDGYKWRKYGQKSVKNCVHPRSYYRCTHHTCNVKKQIQRLSKDTSIIVTTYEGIHNHPCGKLMETLSPLLRQLQFLSSF